VIDKINSDETQSTPSRQRGLCSRSVGETCAPQAANCNLQSTIRLPTTSLWIGGMKRAGLVPSLLQGSINGTARTYLTASHPHPLNKPPETSAKDIGRHNSIEAMLDIIGKCFILMEQLR
jgi:hypothetical protein